MRYLDIIINTLAEPDLWPMDLDRDAEMVCSFYSDCLPIEDASDVKQLCWLRNLLREGKTYEEIISLARQRQQSLLNIIEDCKNKMEVGIIFSYKEEFEDFCMLLNEQGYSDYCVYDYNLGNKREYIVVLKKLEDLMSDLISKRYCKIELYWKNQTDHLPEIMAIEDYLREC